MSQSTDMMNIEQYQIYMLISESTDMMRAFSTITVSVVQTAQKIPTFLEKRRGVFGWIQGLSQSNDMMKGSSTMSL